MKINIIRKTFTNQSTIGEIFINGAFICFSLEDTARALGVKIKGQTAIPAGEYKLKINFSNRFNKLMPLIYNRSDFSVMDGAGARWTGIRLHAGNTDKQTEGCPLLGMIKGVDRIDGSVDAFTKLFPILLAELGDIKEADLTILNKQII